MALWGLAHPTWNALGDTKPCTLKVIQDTLTVWGSLLKVNRPGAVKNIHVARLLKRLPGIASPFKLI